MIINTNRLILRPFALEDAEIYFQITRDKYIQEFVPFACPDTLEETKSNIQLYYAKGDFVNDFYFILEEKKSHEIIGALIITKNISNEYDMSLLIASHHRKNGFMLEAIKGFISTIPEGTTLMFLIATHNTSSLALMNHLEDVKEVITNLKNRRKFLYTK